MSAARDHRLFHLLQITAHRVKIEADRATLAACGITAAQAAVLSVVARTPAATQKQVAQQLRQRESAVTTMVARLTEAGLLLRAPSPQDGRAWSLSLTPAGEAALAGFRAPLDDLNTALTHALGGDPQVETLALALKAILEADLTLPRQGEGERRPAVPVGDA